MKKNDNEIIARYISSFLYDYAPNFLTRSSDTLKSYSDTLKIYILFLEKMDVKPVFLCHCHFEREYIEKWILWLQSERQCSPASCNVRLGCLRTFLEYVSTQNVRFIYLYQEAKQIKTLKAPKRRVHGIPKEGVELILEQPDLKTKTGRRDFTLIMLMYGIAARINEILSIQIKDLHLKEKEPYVTLSGKGDKLRPAYLLPRIVTNISNYIIEFHGTHPNPNDYLFYSRVGKCKNKITQVAIDKRIKKYASVVHEKLDAVPKNLHAHQLRHAKATHWLEDKMNIVQIQFLLGHESLETTMKYLDITPDMKLEALSILNTEEEATVQKKWKNTNSSSLSTYLGFN